MGSKTWADLAGEMKTFLWNPEERTCLGRTAKSWGRSLLEPRFWGLLPFLLHNGCTCPRTPSIAWTDHLRPMFSG